jgi:hypothetical protein
MKYALFLLIVILTLPVFAQEQTLIGSGDIENGGFVGTAVKVTSINGENAVLVGGRVGWIINHTFVLGGAGYGLVTNVRVKKNTDSVHQYIEMGYGGLDLEYIASSNDLVHLSLGLLIGAGGIGYKDEDNDMFDNHRTMESFFVMEPSVHANLNVTHFFRIAGGVSYRYVNGLKSPLSTNTDLSGLSGVLTLKFGKF